MTGLSLSIPGGARHTTRTLHDIAQALVSAHGAEARVCRVLELLRHMLPYDGCVLLEAGQPPRLLAVPETLAEQATLRLELMRLLRWLREQARPELTDYGRVVTAPLPWRSCLIVPLLALDQVVGLLLVGHAGHAAYDTEDLSLLTVVAAQLGAYLTALQNTGERRQAEAALQGHAQRLELLHHVGRAIGAMQPPSDFAQEALNRICRFLPCHAGRILLYDFDAAEARIVAFSIEGQTAAPQPTPIALAHIPSLGVLSDGNVYLADSSADRNRPQTRQAFQQQPEAWICAPLKTHGALLGSLELLADRPANSAPEQIAAIREIADQIAIGIQQALLCEQVRGAEQDLQRLSRQMIEVQENERRHLALELHDEIGQTLTGLKLTLEMIQRLPIDEFQRRLSEAQGLVNELMDRVRQLSLDLRPAMLDDLGLLPTLLWHFERYTAQTSVEVTFGHTGLNRRFAPEVETAAYRIVQEALTNVARHSQVRHATVSLWVADGLLTAQIEDQGVGFSQSIGQPISASHGLPGMRERCALLGGELLVETMPGMGTLIRAELPVQTPAASNDGAGL